MPRSRVLYTLLLTLTVLLIRAPVGAGPRAVDVVVLASEAKPAELSAVVINGVTVPKAKITSLERAYGVPIQPGLYWYDKLAGLWGIDGGPLMTGSSVPFPCGAIFTRWSTCPRSQPRSEPRERS